MLRLARRVRPHIVCSLNSLFWSAPNEKKMRNTQKTYMTMYCCVPRLRVGVTFPQCIDKPFMLHFNTLSVGGYCGNRAVRAGRTDGSNAHSRLSLCSLGTKKCPRSGPTFFLGKKEGRETRVHAPRIEPTTCAKQKCSFQYKLNTSMRRVFYACASVCSGIWPGVPAGIAQKVPFPRFTVAFYLLYFCGGRGAR